jgi:hypothetical protein
MISLDDIFNSLKWSILVFAIISTALALFFPTPEAQNAALSLIGLQSQTPEIDTPLILTVIWIIWIILIMSQMSWLMMKVASDRAVMDGVDRPESCIASNFHLKGNFGFIRVKGSKLLPAIAGTCAWIAPLTHIHKIENTLWIESHAIPDANLGYVPPELKDDVYQRRNGIFGIKECSIGLLSSQELQENSGFEGEDYKDVASKDDQHFWTTSIFITAVLKKCMGISVQFDYFDNDTKSIEEKIGAVKRIGSASKTPEKKGLLDYIMVNE